MVLTLQINDSTQSNIQDGKLGSRGRSWSLFKDGQVKDEPVWFFYQSELNDKLGKTWRNA